MFRSEIHGPPFWRVFLCVACGGTGATDSLQSGLCGKLLVGGLNSLRAQIGSSRDDHHAGTRLLIWNYETGPDRVRIEWDAAEADRGHNMQRLKDFLARATLFVSILASGTHALGQSCDAELLGSFGGSVLGIAIEDDLAFVAANTGGLMIFDISDPDHPQWLHSMPSIYNAQHIAVRDGVVYLANLWAPGSFLTIIDARDPLHPVPLGEVEVARDAR